MNPISSWLARRRLQSQVEQVRTAVLLRQLQMRENFYGSMDNLVDVNDEFEGWLFLDSQMAGGTGGTSVPLSHARSSMRRLWRENGWCRNVERNLKNYVAGKTGFTYTFAIPKRPVGDRAPESFEPLVDAVTAVWEEFVDHNSWHQLEREIVANAHRDGEHFTRYFTELDGTVVVRVIDAASVKADTGNRYPEGVVTDPVDKQKVLAYVVNDEIVDAEEVEHIKLNTDRDVLRGYPTLWVVREKLVRAEKISRNMGKVCELQAAIAMVREQPRALSADDFGSFISGKTDKTKTDPVTGRTINQERILSGAIIDVNPGGKISYPVASSSLDQFRGALQSQLRAVAAAINFPEHMLTADASNNNFASILVAAAPSTKEFEGQQSFFVVPFSRVTKRVIRAAVSAGRLPPEAEFLQCDVQGPDVETRDPKQVAETRQIEHDAKVLSRKTWRDKAGYDHEEEERNIEDEAATGIGGPAFPIPPGLAGGPPQPNTNNPGDNPDNANGPEQ